MASKIDKMGLAELYAQPKCTPAVLRSIQSKDSFTEINQTYCDFACPLGKTKVGAQLGMVVDVIEPVDVLFVFSHPSPDEKFKTGGQMDAIYQRILAAAIRRAGMNASYAVVYAYKCRQNTTKSTITAIRRCEPYLATEVRRHNPKVIVALGAVAAQVMGIKTSKNSRGTVAEYLGIPVVITINPMILTMVRQNSSGDLWGPDYVVVLEADIRKVVSILEHGLPPSIDVALDGIRDHICIIKSLEELDEVVERLSRERIISFDIETTSLDPWADGARILMVQLGEPNGEEAWVITLWHRDFDLYDADEAWEILVPLLMDERVTKLGHNVLFDALYVLVTKGVRVGPIRDTMQFLHSIDSGIQGQYGLKTAVSDYLFETGLSGYEDQLSLGDLQKGGDDGGEID